LSKLNKKSVLGFIPVHADAHWGRMEKKWQNRPCATNIASFDSIVDALAYFAAHFLWRSCGGGGRNEL
jgi:hypothetical protein